MVAHGASSLQLQVGTTSRKNITPWVYTSLYLFIFSFLLHHIYTSTSSSTSSSTVFISVLSSCLHTLTRGALERVANCAQAKAASGSGPRPACSQVCVCVFENVERRRRRRKESASAQSSQSLLFSRTLPVCTEQSFLNGHFCGTVSPVKTAAVAAPFQELLHAGFYTQWGEERNRRRSLNMSEEAKEKAGGKAAHRKKKGKKVRERKSCLCLASFCTVIYLFILHRAGVWDGTKVEVR